MHEHHRANRGCAESRRPCFLAKPRCIYNFGVGVGDRQGQVIRLLRRAPLCATLMRGKGLTNGNERWS